MKKNPEAQKHSVDWLKNKITEKQFNEIAAYYRGYQKAKIRWFDKTGGEGMVRLSDGPLKDFPVFVHGSAFGGDLNFGQNTKFEATEGLPVLVKLLVDWNYIQVSSMKQANEMKKNPNRGECIFKTPDQMREFLNKHLKDRWQWKKNKIVVHTGQGNWKIARAVEDFFKIAGFQGASSEMDEKIGNIYVSAFVPRSVMIQHEQEMKKNPTIKNYKIKKVINFIKEFIEDRDYVFEDNIKSKKNSKYLVFASLGNNQEYLTLYIDCNCPESAIPRFTLDLGYYEDFTKEDRNLFEDTAVAEIKKLGLNAEVDYQKNIEKRPSKRTIKFKYGEEIEIPQKIIDDAPEQGKFDEYADWLLSAYDVEVSLSDSKKHLKEYGAWTDKELNDLELNKARLLWLAILDCKENKTNIWYMGL